MAQDSVSSTTVSVPSITEANLFAFHDTHFSSISVDYFSNQFLGPVVDEEEEEEDDGLGYYPDGVKRTLTDEQIAMFRHSEIEAILRERRYAQEAREDAYSDEDEHDTGNRIKDGEIDGNDEALPAETETLEPISRPHGGNSAKGNKGRRKNKKGSYKHNVKPDLRKRTWDKVERGLGSLDYGEEEGDVGARQGATSQRRRISYDDA